MMAFSWLWFFAAFPLFDVNARPHAYKRPAKVPKPKVHAPQCDAGAYVSTSCVNHHVAIGLSAAASTHYHSVQWSVSHPKMVISRINSITPILKMKPGESICNEVVKVSLTVKNNQGATDSCFVEVGISDHVKPTFTVAVKDQTVECDDVPAPPYVAAKDDCDKHIDVKFKEVEDTKHSGYTIWREWTAMDRCGNAEKVRQKVTVVDSHPPELVGVGDDKRVSCDEIPKPCAVVSYDNCDTDNEVIFTEETVDGSCDDAYLLVRCWSVTDNAHNAANKCQTITVYDDAPPVLVGVPLGDESYPCDAIPKIDAAAVTATDNCDDDVHIRKSEKKIPGSCPHAYSIKRKWEATDSCGNAVFQTSTAVIYAKSPSIDGVASDVTISCDAQMSLCEPEASDPCDYGIELEFKEEKESGSCSDEYILYRTWTATNLCGNHISQTQTVTVVDKEGPRFITHPPAKKIVQCDKIPVYSVQAVDNCDDKVNVVFDEVSTKANKYQVSNYDLHRSWTATDNCGHSERITQTIIISDSSPPVLFGVPPSITTECDNVPIGSKDVVTVHDDCECEHLKIDYREKRKDGSCLHNYILIRSWTGTDCAGNTVTKKQTITVVDTTEPVLRALEGETKLSIEELAGHVYFKDGKCEDNCDKNVVAMSETDVIESGSCAHNYHIIKNWHCEDVCGHRVVKSNTVTVNDHVPPVLAGVPSAYLTWECDDPRLQSYADNEILNGKVVTATDNSQVESFGNVYGPPQVYFKKEKITSTCKDSYELHLQWWAVDDCGNKVDATVTIRVVDYQPPVISKPPPRVICDDCSIPPSKDLVTVKDNCAEVILNFEEIKVYGPSECQSVYTLRREWTATDNCGNVAQPQYQIVEVVDKAEPVWVTPAPADYTTDCEYNPDYDIHPVAVEKNCYDITNSTPIELDYKEETINADCDYQYVVARKWIATDCIGNSAVATQTVTVQDTTAPKFTVVAYDTTVNCVAPMPPAVAAVDNCGYAIHLVFKEDREENCTKDYVLYRTWTATDFCGNTAFITQTVTVRDNEFPIIRAPKDASASCDEELSPDDGVCTDDCSYVTTKFEKKVIPSFCAHRYVVIRKWTCEDECGKEATHIQTVNVGDNEAPTFDEHIPTDITAECDNIPEAPSYISSSDNCGYPNTVMTSEIIESQHYGNQHYTNFNLGKYDIIRSWILKDACGNTATYFQTVHVDDTTPPVIHDVPKEVSVPCETAPFWNRVYVTDNCDHSVQLRVTKKKIKVVCTHKYTWHYQWEATDMCGNRAFAESFMHIEDSEKPVFVNVVPSYHYLAPIVNETNVDSLVPPPRAIDNCDWGVKVTCVTTKEPGCTDSDYTLTRVCQAYDSCKNGGYPVTQVFEIEDREPCEFISFPEDITVECSDDLEKIYTRPSHECDYMTFAETLVSQSCEDNNKIIKTWTLTDECGNSKSKSQTITIDDTKPPTIDTGRPIDVTYPCKHDTTNYLALTDNCDYAPTQIFKEKQIYYNCAHDYKIEQEWIIKDRCGNTDIVKRYIVVKDNELPVVGKIPADITVDHLGIPPRADYIPCSDQCPLEYTSADYKESVVQGSCPEEKTITRKWCCSDCMNKPVCKTQVISVVDDTPPSFYSCPPDETHLGEIPPIPTLYATDSYGVNASVTFEQTSGYSGYDFSLVIERVWTAVDNCENKQKCFQKIFITEKPPIICVPENMTLDCTDADKIPTIGEVTEEITKCSNKDYLGNEPAVKIEVFEDKKIPGSCNNEYCLIRTWEAVDNLKGSLTHGETSYTTQTICVWDTHGPTWDFDAYRTIDCSDAHLLPGLIQRDHPVTAKDDCGSVTITPGPFHPTSDYGYTYDFTATDQCGHKIEERMMIAVVDMEKPKLSAKPKSLTVECSLPPALDGPNIITCKDNCGEPKLVTYEVVLEKACSHRMKVVRGWQCTDNKGNVDSHEQTITVIDDKPPVWTGTMPGDITLECDEELPSVPLPEAEDNCAHLGYVTYLGETHSTPAKVSYGAEILTILRKWIVYDDCGLFIDWTQSIQIYDTEYPVLHGVPKDSEAECSYCLCSSVIATDNCGSPLLRTWNVTRQGTCATEKVVITYWEAVDDVGHSVHDSQTLVIKDSNPPEFVGYYMSDSTVDCHQVPQYFPTSSGAIIAKDDCDGEVDVVYNEELEKSAYWLQAELFGGQFGVTPGHQVAGVEYNLVRTWSATDSCGHHIQKQVTISVNDYSSPIFTNCPASVTVSCKEKISMPKKLKVTDNCDSNVHQNFSQTVTDGTCIHEKTYINTWYAVDIKDNYAICTQTITVVDDSKPKFTSIPKKKIYLPCEDWLHSQPAELTATDDCGHATVKYKQNGSVGSCENEGKYTRVWNAVDDCGNSFDFEQSVVVTDTVKPFCVKCPPAYTSIDCTETMSAITVTFKDNCDNDVSVKKDEKILDSTCNQDSRKVFYWTATDNCGNSVREESTVAITDTTAPMFTKLPNNTEIECRWTDVELQNWIKTAVAVDDCDDSPTMEHIHSVVPGTCKFDQKQVWTWIATDDCGNSNKTSRTISYNDNVPPYFTGVPTDYTLECSEGEPTFNVQSHDDCGGAFGYLQPSKKVVPGSCEHSVKHIYVWSSTDHCGNSHSATVTVTYLDTKPPVMDSYAFGGSVPCDNIPETPTIKSVDNCDANPVVRYSYDGEESYDVSQYDVVHRWEAVDQCGNKATTEATINVFDQEYPVISAVMDITVPCKDIPKPADVVCHDNCDKQVSLRYNETTLEGSCDHDYNLVRTWTCEDNAGLIVTAEYTVTIQDDEGPSWTQSAPKDTTIECDQVIPYNFNNQAQDYCDYNVNINFVPTLGIDKCKNVSTYRWTATDSCGFSINDDWSLTIIDSTAPVFSSYPKDRTVSCSEFGGYGYGGDLKSYTSVWPGVITATDNCHYGASVKFGSKRIPGDCEDDFQFVLFWTAHDECDNKAEHSMTIHVYDDQPPVWGSGMPNDYTISAYAPYSTLDGAINDANATDLCDSDVEITATEQKLVRQYNRECDNEWLIIRTFTATDNCGNAVTHTHSISAIDNEAPTLPVIDDVTLECDEYEGYADCEVKPTSEGDEHLEVHTHSRTTHFTNYYQVYKTWSVTDCAYQSSNTTQTITVIDSAKPVFSRYPADTTIECGCESKVPQLKAYDNCDTVKIDYTHKSEEKQCTDTSSVVSVITRKWVAADSSGNIALAKQIVTIVDDTDPKWCDEVYGAVTYECDSFPSSPPLPVCSDECDADVQVQLVKKIDGKNNDMCNIKRIYVYECEDDCGNNIAKQLTLTANDRTAPVLDVSDDVCIFPSYGQAWGVWAVYDISTFFASVDNCEDDNFSGDYIMEDSFICNATDLGVAFKKKHVSQYPNSRFLEECIVLGDHLYVKVDRNSDPSIKRSSGRTYHVHVTLTDDCDNARPVRRDIFIPLDSSVYNHHKPCENGNPKFVKYLPQYQ